MEIVTKEVHVEFNGVITSAYEARPKEGGVYPGIVLASEFWGLVQHIKDVAERFAKEGYVVVAPDLYATCGGLAANVAEAQTKNAGLSDEIAIGQLKAALTYLQQRPFVDENRIAALGYCMGGRLSLLLAQSVSTLAACITYYGSPINKNLSEAKNLNPIEHIAQLTCPFLGIYGKDDSHIPVEDISALKNELDKHSIIHEVYLFAQAGHAFANDTRTSYHLRSSRQAWNATTLFLKKWV
jgi:carboxymethylenebutenolidase